VMAVSRGAVGCAAVW